MPKFRFLLKAIRWLRARIAEDEAAKRLMAENEGLLIRENVIIREPSRLRVGCGVTVDAGAVLHCGGGDWSDGRGYIHIGDRCYIGPHCVLFGAGGIEMGKAVLLAPGVLVLSHGHTFEDTTKFVSEQPVAFAPVVIQDDVYVGAGAIILPGVRIEAGSVIGAGAVVTQDVPPCVICTGVPSHIVRRRGEKICGPGVPSGQ